MILIIPIITRSIGITAFGMVAFSSRFHQFAASIINWGTGQSAVKDVAMSQSEPQNLRNVVYNVIFIRLIIFVIFVPIVILLGYFGVYGYQFLLFSLPIALAEVFNPISLFTGVEKLKVFNFTNLIFNILCVLSLLTFVKIPADAVWVNFIIGGMNSVTYLVLLIYFCWSFRLSIYVPSAKQLLAIGKSNFYLTINNLSVNLQQSIIIFALPRWGYASLLGPYTVCDRIVGQLRNVLIVISNAIYPSAARKFQQSKELWRAYRKKVKLYITALFFVGALFTFFTADLIIFILSKEHNAAAVFFLRVMVFVPVISALNVFNVLDQLLKNNNVYIFRIALILLVFSALLTLSLYYVGSTVLVSLFTFMTELLAWFLYEYIVRKDLNGKQI